MNCVVRGFHVLLLWLAATGLCFASEDMICPNSVRLASGNIVSEDVPPGYKPFVSSSMLRLTGVTIFEGQPENGAALKPSSVSSNGESIKWNLDGNTEGIWISCDYANGLIRLVRNIGETNSSCTAIIKKTEPYKIFDAKFICK